MVKNIDIKGGGKIFPKDMLSIYEKLEKMIKSFEEIHAEEKKFELEKSSFSFLIISRGKSRSLKWNLLCALCFTI